MTIHETHVCRDCGVEITLPYATPRYDPNDPPEIDGCKIVHRGDGFDVCRVHLRYWRSGTEMCPGRNAPKWSGRTGPDHEPTDC